MLGVFISIWSTAIIEKKSDKLVYSDREFNGDSENIQLWGCLKMC